MYSDDERIETFREECQNYFRYQNRIKDLQEQLESLTNRYENVHSPVLDRVGTSGTPSERDRVIQYMDAKTKLDKRIDVYQRMLDWIESCIDKVPLPSYRILIWQTFIQGYKLSAMATKYDVSQKHIGTTRRKCLLKVLTDEMMKTHDQIQMEMIDAETSGLRRMAANNSSE